MYTYLYIEREMNTKLEPENCYFSIVLSRIIVPLQSKHLQGI